MVFDLAWRLKLSRAATVFATFFAVTCVFTATLSFQEMTETLYTFGVVLSVWLLPVGEVTRLLRARARWRLAAAGFAMGCTSLVRPLESTAVAVFLAIAGFLLLRRLGVRKPGLRARVRKVGLRAVVAGVIFAVGARARSSRGWLVTESCSLGSTRSRTTIT